MTESLNPKNRAHPLESCPNEAWHWLELDVVLLLSKECRETLTLTLAYIGAALATNYRAQPVIHMVYSVRIPGIGPHDSTILPAAGHA